VFIQQQAAEPAFKLQNTATVREITKNIKDKWRQGGILQTSAPPNPCPAMLMSIDAGLVNNSFAVTILCLQKLTVGSTTNYLIAVPVLLEIQPKPGHQLHYPMIYKNVLKPLIKDYNVRFFFADRWNSITTLDTAAEDFVNVDLEAKQYSVKYNDFITCRSYLEEGKLLLPKLEMAPDLIRRVDDYPSYFDQKSASHLLFQMITVRDKGKTVIKGEGFTDDLFRALVLGVSRITDEKIREKILELSIKMRPKITGAVSAGRSLLPSQQPKNPIHTYLTNLSTNLPMNQGPAVHRGNANVVRVNRGMY
jgi:hypothetical protein